MKIRSNYVSNSSSSSFIVSQDVSSLTPCIKLPENIWKSIDKNFVTYEGKLLNLSNYNNDWWLTTLISDSEEVYHKISNIEYSFEYLSGCEAPYGWYENENDFTVFHLKYNDFYISNDDLIGEKTDIPSIFELKKKCEEILNNKKLNNKQKVNAIKFIMDF